MSLPLAPHLTEGRAPLSSRPPSAKAAVLPSFLPSFLPSVVVQRPSPPPRSALSLSRLLARSLSALPSSVGHRDFGRLRGIPRGPSATLARRRSRTTQEASGGGRAVCFKGCGGGRCCCRRASKGQEEEEEEEEEEAYLGRIRKKERARSARGNLLSSVTTDSIVYIDTGNILLPIVTLS